MHVEKQDEERQIYVLCAYATEGKAKGMGKGKAKGKGDRKKSKVDGKGNQNGEERRGEKTVSLFFIYANMKCK